MHKKVFSILLIILLIVLCFTFFAGCTKEYNLFAFGTMCTFESNASQKQLEGLKQELLKIDSFLSSTNLAGDIFKINSSPANIPIKVSNETYILIKKTKDFYDINKSFNPSLYPIVELWHFSPDKFSEDITPLKKPTESEVIEALQYSNFDFFILDDSTQTVIKSIDEAKLDLGAVAKGFACDYLYEKISKKNSIVINLGGTIRTSKDITVHVKNPRNSNNEPFAATLKVPRNMAIATSGDYERYYILEGKRYHHIFDKNGYPAGLSDDNPIVSVSIIGPDALTCDYLSTLVFILGISDESSKLLKDFNSSAIIFKNDCAYIYGDIEFKMLDNKYKVLP